MKQVLAVLVIAMMSLPAIGQKYFTRDGKVSFHSDAAMEKIEAVNNKVTSVLDLATGEMEFAVLIKSFHFEKALMEEHFNENYMESSKIPKATFKGKASDMSAVNVSKSGKYPVKVSGDLTIHGVTKPVTVDGTLVVDSGKINASAVFEVAVADYEIEIPKVVRENIAKIVQIRVDIDYKPLEQ
jgi:polyisoprenoid-binding protein YceI